MSRGVETFWRGLGPEADDFLDLGPKFFVKISTKISLFNATNIKNLTHD